jgi:hypothetical protein
MTLNAAWIRGDNVFLVADTSATTPGLTPRSSTTSLGQPQTHPNGSAVEEIAGKLVQLGSHAAAALCGDARGAIAFVRSVRQRLDRDPISLGEACRAAGHSLMHEVPPFGDFVVTLASWDDGPGLQQYRSARGEMTEVQAGAIVEGSLRPSRVDEVLRQIEGLPGPAIHPQVVLAASLACLNGMSASEDLVADFVAGAFYGLTIGPAGVVWQPNLLYVFYQNDGRSFDEVPMHIVSTRILDGVYVTGSSLSNSVRCLVDPVREVDPGSWMDRNGDRLDSAAAMQESRLVVFVRATGASVVIVDNDGSHFAWEHDDGLQFAMSPELSNRLRWRPGTPGEQKLSLGVEPSQTPLEDK